MVKHTGQIHPLHRPSSAFKARLHRQFDARTRRIRDRFLCTNPTAGRALKCGKLTNRPCSEPCAIITGGNCIPITY